jgi:nucleotide-binding universal stress UspA family protein
MIERAAGRALARPAAAARRKTDMAIKTILAPMLYGSLGAAALPPALVAARKFNAHVVGLHIRPSPMLQAPYVYPPFVVSYVTETSDEFNQQCNDRAQELRTKFEDICAEAQTPIVLPTDHSAERGPSASWRDEKGEPPFDYATAARVADLAVLAALDEDASAGDRVLSEEIVFQSGGPVLFATDENFGEFPETAIVAWNGGLEAARAMRSAIPVLQLLRQVTILTIDDVVSGGASPERAADYLQMHGVRAVHDQVSRGSKRAEEVLIAAATQKDAGLIVMGAYSHTRWREAVLGGFTRALLRQRDIPILMAH